MSVLKPIAIHLPQYHPIPENDKWWGKGFTEWQNVVQGKPRFNGHYQPHLPKDLGFYDLRLIDALEAQANLAKEYGIHGFCFYHYWFNGKKLLEKPIENMLHSKKPDFPFCLCWANENWTRRWDGADHEVLIEQRYSSEDDRSHIRYLINFFRDDRYIKIDGKPVFLVYRVDLHPNMNNAVSIWKEELLKAGFPGLYLIRVENFDAKGTPDSIGFDAGLEFAPDWNCVGEKYTKKNSLFHIANKALHKTGIRQSGYLDNRVYSYPDMVDNMLKKKKRNYPYYRCVCPNWDNSARRKSDAIILLDSKPEKFGEWVLAVRDQTKNDRLLDDQIFFINAWNEWAEGCHLEPDLKYGRAYLEAFKQNLELI